MPTSQYEIPRFGAPATTLLGWCLEAEAEGRAWLTAQRPTQGWERALQMLSAPNGDADAPGDGLSNVGYNKGKRIARELVASLANFRHVGVYKPTWNTDLYDRAHTLSDLDEHWQRTTFFNARVREALQFGVATGTGYLYETWDKHFHGPFKGDIALRAIAPNDVTVVQLPKSNDLQRAYAVIIREELPINLARAMYGETNMAFAQALVPDRDQPGWLAKGLQKLQQFVSPALRVAGRMGNQQSNASFPTVDIFHMYTLDRSINEGPVPVQMGVLGTNWSYTVPSLGDPMPVGIINPQTGNSFTEPATAAHCRLFPLRRYTIFSRTAIGYDGSSPWWHGCVPLARVRFNDWAWEALGSTLVGEVKTMQDGIVALMRAIEDSAAARLDPPMITNDQLAESWAQAVNPRRAGGRARAPMSQLGADGIMQPMLPAEYYNVPEWIQAWIQAQEERMDYVAAVKDLVAIAKAKQVPGADTLEKLMEMAGPIVQDMVRQLEEPLQQLGEWRKAYYFQFYTKARMITVTGPTGVDVDKQYRPEALIPILDAQETPDARALRTRGYLDDFGYHLTESGINEIHRMSTKLFYIQLMKSGFPISWWTFADIAQIPNFGPPPEGAKTEFEKWVAQKRIETDLAVEQQQEVAAQLGGGDPTAAAGAGGAGGEGIPAGGGPAGGNGGPGRPPSFNKAPRLESKDGGARSTIATS